MVLLGMLFIGSFLVVATQIRKARDLERKWDLKQISGALEEYFSTFNTYPSALPFCGGKLTINNVTFMNELPCDPLTNENYNYQSCATDSHTLYKLYANLEISEDEAIADVNCTSGCGPECNYNYGVSSPNTSLDNCALTYVCEPGGGNSGSCAVYDSPEVSDCPVVFYDDPTCNSECGDKSVRCKNASGKNLPETKITPASCM